MNTYLERAKGIYRKWVPIRVRLKIEKLRIRCSERKCLKEINRYFHSHPEEQKVFQEELAFLNRMKRIRMIPYSFALEMDNKKVEVLHDPIQDLPYVIHLGRPLYFPEGTTCERIQAMYRDLRIEQHGLSPHRYFSDSFIYGPLDTFIDVGASEGLISLGLVDTVQSIILIEPNPQWYKPLTATFFPWKEKVTILSKTASSSEGYCQTTIDSFSFSSKQPVLIKVDVEGAEEEVLRGAANTLEMANTRVVCCTYHHHGDSDYFDRFFAGKGFRTEFSNGYLLPTLKDMQSPPCFRKGVIRAWRSTYAS